MFTEYLPFMIKYFYHIIIGIVSFILLKKFFEHLIQRTVQSGTSVLTEESTESSESNVAMDTFMYIRHWIQVSIIFASFWKISAKKRRKILGLFT